MIAASPLSAQPAESNSVSYLYHNAAPPDTGRVNGMRCMRLDTLGGVTPPCRYDAAGRTILRLPGEPVYGHVLSHARPGSTISTEARLEVWGATGAEYEMLAQAGYDTRLILTGDVIPAKVRVFFVAHGTCGASHTTSVSPFAVKTCGVQTLSSSFPRLSMAQHRISAQRTSEEFHLDVKVAKGSNDISIGFLALSSLQRPAGVADGRPWSGTARSAFPSGSFVAAVAYLDAEGKNITKQVSASWDIEFYGTAFPLWLGDPAVERIGKPRP